MNSKKPLTTQLRPWSLALMFMAVTIGLGAQPTGNPKGAQTAPETSAPKALGASSSRGRPADDSARGKLEGGEAQSRARVQGAKPPGGGTEGGLPKREAVDPGASTGTRSDKGSAVPRPVPPTK